MAEKLVLSETAKGLLAKVRMIVPPLLEKFHKGQLGRVAVIGGSQNYTGAPYFSAIASARLGADLSHVICTPPAASVIKTYSPNLMVHPLLRETPHSDSAASLAKPVISLIPNLHVLVIGPGLGRDPLMQDTVAEIIGAARSANLPLVLDADALFLVQNRPELVHGYQECVLTPNVVEFGRLAKAVGVDIDDEGEKGCRAVAKALGGVLIVRKGREDWLSDGDRAIVDDLEGGRKRSGGQGDTLTGCIGTLLAWRGLYLQKGWNVEGNLDRAETLMLAAWGGSALTRECSRLAFARFGRSLQASDLTDQVSVAFETLLGEEELGPQTRQETNN